MEKVVLPANTHPCRQPEASCMGAGQSSAAFKKPHSSSLLRRSGAQLDWTHSAVTKPLRLFSPSSGCVRRGCACLRHRVCRRGHSGDGQGWAERRGTGDRESEELWRTGENWNAKGREEGWDRAWALKTMEMKEQRRRISSS